MGYELEKETRIDEKYLLEHIHDTNTYRHYAYENDMLSNMTTPYIWKNKNMNTFLTKIQDMVVMIYQKNVLVRNFYNITVNRFYNNYYR